MAPRPAASSRENGDLQPRIRLVFAALFDDLDTSLIELAGGLPPTGAPDDAEA